MLDLGVIRLALFALVAGCWWGTPPPEPPPVPRPVAQDASPPDAPAEAPADAPMPVDAGIDAAAPVQASCIRARIVKIEVVGPDTDATVAASSRQGVAMGWRAKLDDGAHTPGQLLRVNVTLSVVRFALTADMIRATPTVVLCPP